MREYPSTDLKQRLGDVLDAASREPVSITRHGKARFVLMNVEAYEARFPEDSRKSYATEEMPAEHLVRLEEALKKTTFGKRGD
ncbi:type II toxin-antitoxin system Phd/YefM family antitoxin [Mesorhizobium sp. J428]|uniref:type II toxin-antitoxin system Phd/YefM family antitoxin n=1 Tax=Mesorhizobium sp. J428 TaxID=2898440 RepID=UPI00215075A4|nr:type II toxin-antitoxin system Phd/YefM family antitoxin [Mesorhizobium sp. J428]MCR5857648.1 type II toxin-antitoxin system Phd/YefM family antitoxin [Mesorhizobium sp. J428]